MPHLLIANARFYQDIADALQAGAEAAITAAGATFETAEVPGALELAPALRFAIESKKFDGYVALGCVIRGETTHYTTVAEESARGLTWLAIDQQAAIGNGILTVENEEQAWVRADPKRGNKGGDAARAALSLIALKKRFAS